MKLFSRLLTTLLWSACVAIPLASVAWRASGGGGLFDGGVLAVARFTALQALASAAISGAIGLGVGLWIGPRGGRVARACLALPYGVPTIVAGFAFVQLLGRTGWLSSLGLPLDWAYSAAGVILAHVFLNAPWVALATAQARADLPEAELEAARTLGAGGFARFVAVTWPAIRLSWAVAVTQAFSLSAMSFGLVLLLGGGPPVETLETSIYARLRYDSLDMQGAAACALWQFGITLVPWLGVTFVRTRRASMASRAPSRRRARRGAGIAAAALAGFFLLPYMGVLLSADWTRLASEPEVGPVLLRSLGLALAVMTATLAATVAAIWAIADLKRGRLLVQACLALPGGVSILVLGMGVWLAYGQWIDPYAGSFGAMVALQATLFFVPAFRLLWPLAESAERRLLDAAATLGATPFQAFVAVEWPRWKAPLAAAAALVFGGSLGEVAAVSLFQGSDLVTLPLLVGRWMAQYRFAEAEAAAALLLALSAVAMGAFVSRGKVA